MLEVYSSQSLSSTDCTYYSWSLVTAIFFPATSLSINTSLTNLPRLQTSLSSITNMPHLFPRPSTLQIISPNGAVPNATTTRYPRASNVAISSRIISTAITAFEPHLGLRARRSAKRMPRIQVPLQPDSTCCINSFLRTSTISVAFPVSAGESGR